MKKFVVLCISFFLFMSPAIAKEQVSFYLFYGEGCPHCAKEEEWLEEIASDYPSVTFNKLETWYNEENENLSEEVKEAYQISQKGVPLTIIGNKYFMGFNDYTKEQIKETLNKCVENSCEDYVTKIKQKEEVTIEKPQEVLPTTETKVKVETKKALFDQSFFIVGIILILALLFFIVLGNSKKMKKSID